MTQYRPVILPAKTPLVTVTAEAQNVSVFEIPVSDIQKSDVAVTGNNIAGTLKFMTEGALAEHWGEGNFLVLKLSNIPAGATSVKVGLDPSMGSGLVEIINDPDKNGAFKITNKNNQKFVVQTTVGEKVTTEYYNLSGLTLETIPVQLPIISESMAKALINEAQESSNNSPA